MEFVAREKELKFTTAMKAYVEEKMTKLDKYLDNTNGRIVLKKEGHEMLVEISLPGNIRSSAKNSDFYSLVSKVINQLERQIKKHSQITHRKEGKMANNIKPFIMETEEIYEEIPIVKEKLIEVELSTVEEAIDSMELLNHDFYAFKDITNGMLSIVYTRKDGKYGILKLDH